MAKKRKRKINYFHLLIVILVPVLIIGVLCYGVHVVLTPKEEVKEVKVEKKKKNEPTIEALLKHSLEPVGSTMYIWGGGWNKADTGAGKEARTIGVSKQWKTFYQSQDENYDYTQYEYQIHNGLDCSGFIGWAVYNTMETKNNQSGYVTESGNIPSLYQEKGFGTVTSSTDVKDYKPGDIMANDEHVYMVLGQYSDESVLLIHSSPPGVRIAGTPSKDGNVNSKAVIAAKEIMAKEYPEWYAKYPDCTVDYSFLTRYDQFRWNSKTMKDANKIQKLSARQIVHLLFD